MSNKLCEICLERKGCDQVFYDCPISDFKGNDYTFSDSTGNKYTGLFKSYDNAQEFAYRAGLLCEGRTSLQGYTGK